MALEKRYNFTLEDMDAVAPAYNHFRTKFAADCPSSSMSTTSMGETGDLSELWGQQISVQDVPQQLEFERGNDLEMWLIRLRCKHEPEVNLGTLPGNA